MKRIFALLIMFLMTLAFWPTKSALAGSAIDEEYTGGVASTVINQSLGRFAQSFKLDYTRLDKVEIELANVAAAQTLTVQIRHKTGTVWDEGNVAIVSNQLVGDSWNTFDFPDITVATGANDSYGIWVTCATNNVQWKYKEPGGYDRGFSIWQNSDEVNMDWNFRAWGYDPTPIEEEQTNPGSDQTPEQTGVTAATGEAPSATVSASVVKPSDLKAEYVAGAKLTWKASTTADITGYIVFRSETKGKSYTKIADVAKTKLEYTDTTAAASKTYYYVVRAAKGVEQSASSNEASLTIPADAAPITPQNLKVDSFGSDYILASWTKNPETNLSGYTIKILKGSEIVKTVDIAKDKVNYRFGNLSEKTDYKIILTAKNTAGKESAAAEVTQKTADAAPANLINQSAQTKMLTFNLIGTAAILVLILVLLLYHRKLLKKAKIA